MAPAAGGAVGGVAAGALANEAYRQKQAEQLEREQQRELDQQAQIQNHDQSYPMQQPSLPTAVSPAPAVPERDPDHHAPASLPNNSTQEKHVPAPVVPIATKIAQTDRGLTTPSTADTSFLDDSEVGAAVPLSGKTINGGPVPVELAQIAQEQAHPGVSRTNTDISVSDLHVPGEYPKGPAGNTAPFR